VTRGCKIIMVTPSLTDQGGIASVVTSYAESSLARDWDVQLIETVRGAGVVRHLHGIGGVIRACVAVARNKSCLVHVHMSYGGSFWRKGAVIAFAHILKRRSVLHLHGSRFHTWATGGSSFRSSAVKRVFGMADKVVVLSESWRALVAQFAERADGVVVPNPVTIPADVSTGREGERVVFLGRLGERKGIYDLLEAIRALQGAGCGARWVLAGDGDIERVEALVSELPRPDLVSVPGWLGREDVRALLGESAVFCLPSYDEGVPIALLEAMAYGLTCIVTPVGGMPEVVHDGENGLVVPVGNADALSERLACALESPAYRRELGDKARSTVESGYAVDRVVEVVGGLYESLGCPRPRAGE